MYRKEPTRIIIYGDREEGEKHVRFAETQMKLLENYMQYAGLQQGVRRMPPNGGVSITCVRNHGFRTIKIYAGMRVDEAQELKDECCFCSCFFAYGQVINFTDEEHVHGDEDVRYDVAVCHKERVYIIFRNCVPTDFAMYRVMDESAGVAGEPVIVFLRSPVDTGECCEKEEEEKFEQLACEVKPPAPESDAVIFWVIPLYVFGLKKWHEEGDC